MRKLIIIALMSFLVSSFSEVAHAQIRYISDTDTFDLRGIVADTSTNYIYAGDWYNQELLVIDSVSESVVNRIAVESQFTDLEISKDNKFLAIAGDSLNLLNLETWELTNLPIGILADDVAFDYKNDLFVSTRSGGFEPISLYDIDTKSVIWQSTESGIPDIRGNSTLDTNQEGTKLYSSEAGSPGEVSNYDVSSVDPISNSILNTNSGRALNDSVYVDALNKLFTIDFNIQVWDGDDLTLLNEERVGLNLEGLDVDPQQRYLYTVFENRGDSSQIDLLKYNLYTDTIDDMLAVETRGTDYRVRDLVIDSTGNKAIVLISDAFLPFGYAPGFEFEPGRESMIARLEIIDLNTYGQSSNVVPEPASFILFGAGAVGAFIRRKRQS